MKFYEHITSSPNFIAWFEYYQGSKTLAWNMWYDPTLLPVAVDNQLTGGVVGQIQVGRGSHHHHVQARVPEDGW